MHNTDFVVYITSLVPSNLSWKFLNSKYIKLFISGDLMVNICVESTAQICFLEKIVGQNKLAAVILYMQEKTLFQFTCLRDERFFGVKTFVKIVRILVAWVNVNTSSKVSYWEICPCQ